MPYRSFAMLPRRILSHLNLCAKKLRQSRSPHFQNVRWTMVAAVDSKPDDSTELANAKSFEEMPSLLMLPWIGTVWMYFPIIGISTFLLLLLISWEVCQILILRRSEGVFFILDTMISILILKLTNNGLNL